MIPIKIKASKSKTGEIINERTIEIPCLWEELSLRQFMQIIHAKEMDAIKLLSILTDLSVEYLSQIPAKSLEVAASYVFFMNEPPVFSEWKKPAEITIQNKTVPVPDINEETFGQKVYLQQEVNRVIADERSTHDAIPYALSLYFYTAITGDKEYTEKKIRDFIPHVMQMKVTEALPTANFFLTNCVKSLKGKKSDLLLNQLKQKHRRESATLKNMEL